MQSIFFKKQALGQWRRDDGELKKHVNEEAMFRELETLVKDGWTAVAVPVLHALRVAEPNGAADRGPLLGPPGRRRRAAAALLRGVRPDQPDCAATCLHGVAVLPADHLGVVPRDLL